MGTTSEDQRDKNKKPETGAGVPETQDELIDEVVDESFPASDPPPMSGATAGSPDHKKRE